MRRSSMACARAGSRPMSTRRLASVLNSMCGSSCDCSSRNWISAAWRCAASAWARAAARRSIVLSTTTEISVPSTPSTNVRRVLVLSTLSMLVERRPVSRSPSHRPSGGPSRAAPTVPGSTPRQPETDWSPSPSAAGWARAAVGEGGVRAVRAARVCLGVAARPQHSRVKSRSRPSRGGLGPSQSTRQSAGTGSVPAQPSAAVRVLPDPHARPQCGRSSPLPES